MKWLNDLGTSIYFPQGMTILKSEKCPMEFGMKLPVNLTIRLFNICFMAACFVLYLTAWPCFWKLKDKLPKINMVTLEFSWN